MTKYQVKVFVDANQEAAWNFMIDAVDAKSAIEDALAIKALDPITETYRRVFVGNEVTKAFLA